MVDFIQNVFDYVLKILYAWNRRSPVDPGLLPPWCCKVSDQSRDPGGRAPWQGGGGCKGAEQPGVEKFSISELNLHNLVHTFYQN